MSEYNTINMTDSTNITSDDIISSNLSYEIRKPKKIIYINDEALDDDSYSEDISRLDTQSMSSAMPHQSLITPNNANTQNLNQYIFSKDFLPVRYDRHSFSDLPLKLMVVIELSLNLALFLVFVTTTAQVHYFDSVFGIIQYIIIWFFFCLTIFWVNYKVHSLLFSFYRMFLDLDCTKRNSKYYSGLEIPDFYVQSEVYPHITIQIPVYKENLKNTIKPTLLHCCREADRYMDETGAYCNIIICDDGYNIISEADRTERVEFYQEIGIGFTARPHPAKYPRKGRFKKAGNLNFSMNFYDLFMMEEEDGPEDMLEKRNKILDLGAVYGGDVTYGKYIFLIDSDTRLPDIPLQENGCLKRLAKEMLFDGKEVLFIQCYTGPYMSVKTASEKSIFNHTCNIYNSILVATACKSMAPLVGHNAFLNMNALQECASIDKVTGFKYFWAEDRISEDFDLMMRGCEKGYIGRYASHAGIFLEGVSFSYMTEYFKISKFACGAAELIYNPMTDWCRDGVISSDLIGFVKSTKIEWYNKIIILSYVLNFIAIAAAHFGLLFNLFFCQFLFNVLPFYLLPINLMWEALFIWTICGTFASYIFGLRLGFDKWIYFKQMCRETLFLTCLYGSISVRFSIMSFTHLFKLNLSFGATAKDDETITLTDWIVSTPMETSVYTLYTFLLFIQLLVMTPPEKQMFVFYFGCVPMLWSIILFWAGPLMWDICIKKDDKTKDNQTYNNDERMFHDKYQTQLPNSPAYTRIIVGSSAKLAPHCMSDTMACTQSAMTESASYISTSEHSRLDADIHSPLSAASHLNHSNSHSHSFGREESMTMNSPFTSPAAFTQPRVYNEDEVFYRLGVLKRDIHRSVHHSGSHRDLLHHSSSAAGEYASNVSNLSVSDNCSVSSSHSSMFDHSARKSLQSVQAYNRLLESSADSPYASLTNTPKSLLTPAVFTTPKTPKKSIHTSTSTSTITPPYTDINNNNGLPYTSPSSSSSSSSSTKKFFSSPRNIESLGHNIGGGNSGSYNILRNSNKSIESQQSHQSQQSPRLSSLATALSSNNSFRTAFSRNLDQEKDNNYDNDSVSYHSVHEVGVEVRSEVQVEVNNSDCHHQQRQKLQQIISTENIRNDAHINVSSDNNNTTTTTNDDEDDDDGGPITLDDLDALSVCMSVVSNKQQQQQQKS